ncbi:hypothetical protein [Acinetobacter sp. yr461]|uniref:hypothetical protein n=1 Tax=Acinetobacter sp. yr461 TaxID=1761742 RepID=UPI0008B7F433|nr:hypothetical protein [Acinetobacter sp. yr461]SEO55268.1 hypothetical protein SAMN04487817_106134 [Acinetobacter sp. yr461]
MKNFLIYSYLLVVIFSLCLFLSLFFKKTLGLEGDYLSAFATLVAALVAFLLFNDWREQHRLHNLESLKLSLHHCFTEMDIAYNELRTYLCDPTTQKDIILSQYSLISNKLNLAIESFCLDLNHYERIIEELRLNKGNLSALPNEVQEKALFLYEILNPEFLIIDFHKMVAKLQPILISKNGYTEFKLLKIKVTTDIQKIILNYLKNKGA